MAFQIHSSSPSADIIRLILEMKKFIHSITQEDFIDIFLNLINNKDFYPEGRNNP